MEKLKNLSAINTNTVEGRLFMAALAIITTESRTDKQPDDVLHACHDLAEKMFVDASPLPSSGPVEKPEFEKALSSLINSYSIENGSDTPDFILAQYLSNSLIAYQKAVHARDKWFGVDMWAKTKEAVAV